MSNKKKFSSFKEQQSLAEGFRRFINESEQDLPEEESYSEIKEEKIEDLLGLDEESAFEPDDGEMSMEVEPAIAAKKAKAQQSKAKTLQKYAAMAKMLRGHGMEIPEDPVGRLEKINQLVQANNIKPKNWNDMYRQLDKKFGASDTKKANRIKHRQWQKKARADVAAKDAKEKGRRKALTPQQRDTEDVKGGMRRGMKRFMNKLNLKGLGGIDEGKELPYEQLVEIITQALMKRESFKKLFEEKYLKSKKKDVK